VLVALTLIVLRKLASHIAIKRGDAKRIAT